MLMLLGIVAKNSILLIDFALEEMDKGVPKMEAIMDAVNRKLRGYWNYYGVRGNSDSLSKLFYRVNQLLFKWLNRRSQKKSYTWAGYNRMCQRYGICSPRIVEKPLQPDLFSRS
jgi:RNA-directed DNA polymerase